MYADDAINHQVANGHVPAIIKVFENEFAQAKMVTL